MKYTYDKVKGEFVLDIVVPTQEEIRLEVAKELPELEARARNIDRELASTTLLVQELTTIKSDLAAKIASIKEGLGIVSEEVL